MLTVIAIIVCASGITTVLLYHDFKMTVIELHKVYNNNDKNTHSQKTYHEMQEEYSKSQPMYIFFVFPMFIVL